MTQFVAGFLMDHEKDWIVIIKKERPDWQRGLYNGVGGHIEDGETPAEAMRREFFEEAGLDIDTWLPYAQVQGPWGVVHFHRAFATKKDMRLIETKTDEQVVVAPVRTWHQYPTIPNLKFLIPLALYTHDDYAPVQFLERAKPVL